MQTNDQPQFEEQLAMLCAAFNVPCTTARKGAYFFGLQKMSLAQFARVVDEVLSDSGPDSLPTVPGIWEVHRNFRRRPQTFDAPRIEEKDHLLYFANRLLFRHVLDRGGLGSTGTFVAGAAGKSGMSDCQSSDELRAARIALRDVVDWFRGPVGEGDQDCTPEGFVDALIAAIDPVSKLSASTKEAWHKMAKVAKPLDEYMARPLGEGYENRPA